jgi:hypothetical protein
VKVGDLIKFNEQHRGLHDDQAIGIVIGECHKFDHIPNKQDYVSIYWLDINESHEEKISDLEVISEAR